MAVILYGYRYSVYTWIARLALAEKRVDYRSEEINPFAQDAPEAYRSLHPFFRVPTLRHDGFVLYETGAITRYVDEAFAGPALQPTDPRERARMAQIISIIDAYGYWPLIRQFYSHRVFRPRRGQPADEAEVVAGIEAAPRVFAALEAIMAPRGPAVSDQVSLADLHLAPMIAYFVGAPEGAAMLRRHSVLSAWWEMMRVRPSVIATTPDLPGHEPNRS